MRKITDLDLKDHSKRMSNKLKKRKDRVKDRRMPNHKSKSTSNLTLAGKISAASVISVVVVVAAYFYYEHKYETAKLKLDETLSALLAAEGKASVRPETRVAIGFGSCQDVIVQSREVLRDPAPKFPDHYYSISSREELLKVFAYFYQHGAAAERYVSNATLFEELVTAAEKAPSAHYEIGGNAPVMARRFAKEGCSVLLGAQMSNVLRDIFPKTVTITGPMVEDDDIHLLLEYPAGLKWGRYIPPRANRFIIHNDHQNPLISSLEKFSSEILAFNPSLFVVGGLQMMDNFPMDLVQRRDRLKKVQDLMRKLPERTHIHFEMASFSDEVLLKDLVQTVIPYADSLGMNEQELPNLYHIMKYGNISLVSESYPRIAAVLDQMRDVFKLFHEQPLTNGRRKLTRLHIHTLAFHALMVEKSSTWKNSLSAIAKSVLTANRHTCGSNTIDTAKAKLVMDEAFSTSLGADAKRVPFDTKSPIACWEEDSIELCVAPVLVCTDVLQTGGGGDNISSAGLVLQI